MRASLQADGSLLLQSENEERVIRPVHKAYPRLMEMYHRACSVGLSAVTAPPAPAPTSAPQQETFDGGNENWKPYKLERGCGGHPWLGGRPDPEQVYEVPLEFVQRNAPLFRSYADERLAQSVSLSAAAPFDSARCGVLAVWKAPTGDVWLVDGYERFGKAEQAGLDTLPFRFIEADSAEQAATKAAWLNQHRANLKRPTQNRDAVSLSAAVDDANLPTGLRAEAQRLTRLMDPQDYRNLSEEVKTEALRALRIRMRQFVE